MMRIPDTPEMEVLWTKIRPYFNEHMQLTDNVPNEIKEAYKEYKRMAATKAYRL